MIRDKVLANRITELKRLKNSFNGNPRWEVTLEMIAGDPWVAKTSADSNIGCTIDNSEYRDRPVWVTFNGRGSIIDVSVAGGGRS